MTSTIKNRDTSLDIIRIIAVFLVLSVHSLGNLGFYSNTISGPRYLIACIMRHFFMSCVPLFMILSGYLMHRKVFSKSYYKGILTTLIIYLLASLASIPVHIYNGEQYTFKTVILQILNFDLAPYSWYIEMYIGLFLIIPFLNHMYHGCNRKKEKQVLIITLIILCSLPSCLNIFDMSQPHWWLNPLRHLGNQKIIPGYWKIIYIFLYYFIGCYLAEFRPQLSSKSLFLTGFLLIAHTVSGGLFNYYANYFSNTAFQWGAWQSWESILNAITASLIFILCLQINTAKWSEKRKKLFQYFASLSLGIYLISWNFDSVFYRILDDHISDAKLHIEFYLPMVILIYFCSAVSSSILNSIKNGILKIINSEHFIN